MLFQQLVNSMCSNCLFPACWQLATRLSGSTDLLVVTSCEWQSCTNLTRLLQACWYYQTCCKVVPTSPIQSWYNNTVKTLCRQPCNIHVISWLNQTCWNNLVTSLIMPSSLFQVVNSLFQTCHNNWEQAVRTQLVDRPVTTCAFLRVYKMRASSSAS
jgi:hypothetical protein